jgi:hypothetical protein
MTKGEYRVGIGFNPSSIDLVWQIKRSAADLIDLIESIPMPHPREGEHHIEVWRLKVLAQTAIEDGAMWAVKAATKPARAAFGEEKK